MTSGGARGRSGPAPDPNALRRDRKDDAGWLVLPVEGFAGEVPAFPLPAPRKYRWEYEDKRRFQVFDEEATEIARDSEDALWEKLWRKPQAFMWAKLGLEHEAAAYVRAFIESVEPEAVSGLKTAVLRMAAEIGLSLPGMHSLRWKFSEDEVAAKRAASAVVPVRSGPSAKDRLAGLKNAK